MEHELIKKLIANLGWLQGLFILSPSHRYINRLKQLIDSLYLS